MILFWYVRITVYPFIYQSLYVTICPFVSLPSIYVPFCLSVLIYFVLTLTFYFPPVLDKEMLFFSWYGLKLGDTCSFFCGTFQSNLNKHVNVKPNRSRLKVDILWCGGGDGDLASKNFSISSLGYSLTNLLFMLIDRPGLCFWS
jgi:hypothetical protein